MLNHRRLSCRTAAAIVISMTLGAACSTTQTNFDGGGNDVTPTDTPAGANCSRAATCDTCTPMAGCGFCRTAQTCTAGNVSGPDRGECSPSDWAWVPTQCASPADSGADAGTVSCGTRTSCATCTPAGGCGWCRTRGVCVAGASSGPSGGECAASDWAWISAACGGAVCTPGRVVSCACSGGTMGTQTCNSAGTGYGSCTGCAPPGPVVYGSACNWGSLPLNCANNRTGNCTQGLCPCELELHWPSPGPVYCTRTCTTNADCPAAIPVCRAEGPNGRFCRRSATS